MTEQPPAAKQPGEGSIMEGIEVSARRPIDQDWSGRKRLIVGVAATTLAVAAVGLGGWYAISSRPPGLPTSAEEAMAVMASDRFDRLSEARQRQYATEAARLLRELDAEQRMALMRDGANEQARRELMLNMMDDMARRHARGEEVQMPFGRPGGREGQDGERRGPPGTEGMSDGERRKMMASRINGMITDSVNSGNAQSNGLRAEFMSDMRSRRGGSGRGP
ncbi:MAG: hypothetical protein AAGA55_06280 [Planctomycetota bacterium]